MSPFARLKVFLFGFGSIFLVNWLFIVALPWLSLGGLQPISTDETNLKPWDSTGEAHQGERIYAANGCAYCHTQQVRPATSGADIVRGWGSAHNADGKEVTRRTYPRDYIWQQQVFLGNNRLGADLSNVAERYPTPGALYRYLYDPHVLQSHSSMPAYRYLFTEQRVTGQPSADALILGPPDQPPAGWEIVPGPDVRALVEYMLSLKKDYHLPDENGPVVTLPSTTPKS